MKRYFRLSVLFIPILLLAQQTPPPTFSVPVLQAEPADIEQRIQRTARGKMFNVSGPNLLDPSFTGDYHIETKASMALLPELPIGESDAIVIGEIKGSSVFVSENKRALYTEYTFSVERMLKPSGGGRPSEDIAILRLGGAARRQTGGVIRHEVSGYGLELSVGSKYLMFLKHTPAPADAYVILKFWNINAGMVTAAAPDDARRVHEQRSVINRKTLAEVVSTIEEADAK